MSNICYDNSNWEGRLEAAKKRKHFTLEDVALASRWATCAIGERLQQRGLIDANELHNLVCGFDFSPESIDEFDSSLSADLADDGIRTIGNDLDCHADALGREFMWAVKRNEVTKATDLHIKIKALRIVLKSDNPGYQA